MLHRKALLATSMLAGVLSFSALSATAVSAQESAPPSPSAGTNTPSEPGSNGTSAADEARAATAPGITTAAGVQAARSPTSVEGVVVTGSRIRRVDLTAVQPVGVIDSQYLQDKGITNIANGINQLPAVGGSITPNGDQGSYGTGRNYINLFNLGSQRTLTLINGRRFVGSNAASQFSGSSPGSQVDLNELPTAFLDRIEEVPATGAAVYGSDAIAGVINVIYKSRFTGVLVDAQAGISDRSDYPTHHISAAVGGDFLNKKLNLAVDFEIDQTSSLRYVDRPQTAAQYSFAANPLNKTLTDGIPGNILVSGRTIPETTAGGLAFVRNTAALSALVTIPDPANPASRVAAQFAPDGTLVPYSIGTFYQSGVASGGDGLSLAPITALQSPLDRKLVNAIGTYEFTPHVRLHGSLFYAQNDATEPTNQPIYNAAIFGGTSGPLSISINNPFLTAQARANIVASLPAGMSNFFLSRASNDIVNNNAVQSRTEALDGVVNLEGDFQFADRDFIWNAAITHGKAEGYFIATGVNQANFLNAIDAVSSNGQIVCRSTLTNPTNGCAPLNLFGAGAPSTAALAYVRAPFRADFSNEQTDYQANLSGTVLKVPAGNWSFGIGYEHRKEQGTFTPDANSMAGVGRSVPITAASGGYNTNEYYIESLLPIFGKDFGFLGARKLELEGAYRRIDNSLAGQNEAWSVGGRYSPIGGVTLRGSRSFTFRAPAITELFLPNSSAFGFATDPCDAANLNAGPNPATRTANCQADFAKLGAALTGFKSSIQTSSAPITTSGNPNLQNENGESWTYGFVLQPKFIPGLAFSADFVHIDITGGISNFTGTSILSTCYDSPSHPADVCGRFDRDPTGQITTVRQGYVNAGYTRFAGRTLTLSYDRNINQFPFVHTSRDLGHLGIFANAFNTQRYQTSVSGTGFDLLDLEGTIGYSRWKYQLDFRYARGPFRANWTTHFIQNALYSRTFTIENQNILSVGDYYTHDLNIEFKTPWKVALRAGVNNLTDKAPPFPAIGIGTYDQIGRYYFAGINARF